jgi:hypothetical protein
VFCHSCACLRFRRSQDNVSALGSDECLDLLAVGVLEFLRLESCGQRLGQLNREIQFLVADEPWIGFEFLVKRKLIPLRLW